MYHPSQFSEGFPISCLVKNQHNLMPLTPTTFSPRPFLFCYNQQAQFHLAQPLCSMIDLPKSSSSALPLSISLAIPFKKPFRFL